MSDYSQNQQIGELKTALPGETLVLTRFNGTEAISELFEFQVECIHETKANLNFDPAIGENCTVTLTTQGKGKRYFNGVLVATQWVGEVPGGQSYQLILRPWLWMLSKRLNSGIFHNKTAPDIIEEVFGEHQFAKFRRSLTKSYPELEYVVQHNESDMDFVCRLMEAHGITYHFEFTPDKHELVLGDGTGAYGTIAGSKRNYYQVLQYHPRDEEFFYTFQPARQFTTGKVATNDYDFKKPSANLIGEKTGSAKYSNGKLEEYVHPYPNHVGEKVKQSWGSDYADRRLLMHEAVDGHFVARGDCMGAGAGMRMTLANHGEASFNREYVILRSTHSLSGQSYRSGGGSHEVHYANTCELIASNRPYVPQTTTRKPLISGVQTAKVVGTGEIDVDEDGRILVHFHWDRKSPGEAKGKSMRVRVAQVWAGAGWGAIFIPRVGMEVLVQFIDGDPDRPIVMGTVYNGQNRPPYTLPGEKNIAGWKTKSTEAGGSGYNELVMIDTTSKEKIRFHGQKDLEGKVENNENRDIGNDRKTLIGNDDKLHANHDIEISATNKITLQVGGSTIVIDNTSITLTSLKVEIIAAAEFKSTSGALSTHISGGPFSIIGLPIKLN